MTRFTNNALATLRLALHWQDHSTRYTDRLVARRVNAWRDIFPPGLEQALLGLGKGEIASCEFGPGELVPPHDPARVLTLPRKRFSGRTRDGKRITPRQGRFYPQGALEGLQGIYPSTMTPARVIRLDHDTLTVDLNHPLSQKPLRVEARVDILQDKPSDTGGQLSHWGEELCGNGPGMQAALPGVSTDFFGQDFFARRDVDDKAFYAQPRIIGHVDAQASANLTAMHTGGLEPGMRVLDLMSSVQTHVPDDMDLRITGLGMNSEEMRQNPLLAEHVTHDLNRDAAIPLDGPFDAVLLSLSLEYLTDPAAVLRSARELLVPGGTIMVGLSNRWFPTKAVGGWAELHEFERVGLTIELLHRAGFREVKSAESIRNDWRPQDDRHFLATRGVSDPVYMIRATKN